MSGLGWTMAGVVLLALVASWLWRSSSDEGARPTAEPPAATAPSASAVSSKPTLRPAPILTIALSPTLVRGASPTPELRITPATEEVLLELQADGGDPSARRAGPLQVAVRTVEGQPIWDGPASAPSESINPNLLATVRLPPGRLPPGDYTVTLSTAGSRPEELYRYSLRVAP